MNVSSNKPCIINLKGNEALTGISTRFTDYENPNNLEKIIETGVSKIFNSKKSKDVNNEILDNSFINKKLNRSKSENSSVSDIEDEKNKVMLNESNLSLKDLSNNYNINFNMDMNNLDELQSNNNELFDNNNFINNQNIIYNLINNQNINENIPNQTIKNQEYIRIDNIIKESLKKPVNNVKNIIEKISNKKFNINLDSVFGTSYKQNRAALKLCIYQILCFNKENKKILLEADANLSEEDKEKLDYFLTRKFKFIFEKYIKNEKEFVINNKKITIKEFKTLDEVIKEKRNKIYSKKKNNKNNNNNDNKDETIKKRKPYNKNYSEVKIENFEIYSKNFLEYIYNGFLCERNNRKNKLIFLIYKTIKKYDDIIKNENASC